MLRILEFPALLFLSAHCKLSCHAHQFRLLLLSTLLELDKVQISTFSARLEPIACCCPEEICFDLQFIRFYGFNSHFPFLHFMRF